MIEMEQQFKILLAAIIAISLRLSANLNYDFNTPQSQPYHHSA